MVRSRRRALVREQARAEAKPPTKAIYIYPGLLRLARQKAINLDSQCPAAIYKCKECVECQSESGDGGVQCEHANGCSICLEDFHERDLVRMLPCSAQHVFHTKCILTWFTNGSRCPLCQEPISDSKRKKPALTEGRALAIRGPSERVHLNRDHDSRDTGNGAVDQSEASPGQEGENLGELRPSNSQEPSRAAECQSEPESNLLEEEQVEVPHISIAEEQIRRNAQANRASAPSGGDHGKSPYALPAKKRGTRSYSYIDYDSSRFAAHCDLFKKTP